MSRLKIGDLIEIPTKKGKVYAQYTHKHLTHGYLIRVFDGFYAEEPKKFKFIDSSKVTITTFIPLLPLVKAKTFKVVSNEKIRDDLIKFPLFRSGSLTKDKTVKTWWLWDGQNETKIGSLTNEQRKLPLDSVWNDTLLIERIESGWRAENNDF